MSPVSNVSTARQNSSYFSRPPSLPIASSHRQYINFEESHSAMLPGIIHINFLSMRCSFYAFNLYLIRAVRVLCLLHTEKNTGKFSQLMWRYKDFQILISCHHQLRNPVYLGTNLLVSSDRVIDDTPKKQQYISGDKPAGWPRSKWQQRFSLTPGVYFWGL